MGVIYISSIMDISWYFSVTVADINDEVPVFEERKSCTVITEFHEARETITVVRATDGDDIDSPNGRIRFTIEGGNEKGETIYSSFKRCVNFLRVSSL